MKKLISLISALVILALTSASVSPSAFAAEVSPSPNDAVTLLMEEIRNWDTQNAVDVLGAIVPRQYASNIGEMILPSMLSRLRYSTGNAKISGRSAEVDIDVTAADTKELMGDIVAEAVGCAAISRITGIPLDIEAYVTERLEKAMSDDTLTTINTRATVYLVMGADGVWKLDMTDIRNLHFFEALTGGLASFEEPLRALFSEILE